MVAYTTPAGIPYPTGGDSIADALSTIPEAMAQAINDYLAGISGVDLVDWTALPLSAGIGGAVFYARRAGVVFMECGFTLTGAKAHGDPLTTALPVGFRPSIQITRLVQGAGTGRGVYMDPDGILRSDFNGTAGSAHYGGFGWPV